MANFSFGNVSNWILFGTTPVLVALLETLRSENASVTVVCGQRHLEDIVAPNQSLSSFLEDHGVQYYISEDVNTDDRVKALITDKTVGVSFDAPWIFKKSFIELFNGKLVNSHGARLPYDRGGGGISWRILKDDCLGYSVLHQVIPKVDAGAIVSYQEWFYPSSCRVPQDYYDYASNKDCEFIQEFGLAVLNNKPFNLMSQPEYLSFYWPRLHTDSQGWIDWDWPQGSIERFIRAFDEPHPGASTLLNDERVRLKSVTAINTDGTFHEFQVGIVYRKSPDALFVATTQGGLVVRQVLNSEGIDIRATIKAGDRFYTPFERLQEAKKYRPSYSAKGVVKT